jgi:hypothetical protein
VLATGRRADIVVLDAGLQVRKSSPAVHHH